MIDGWFLLKGVEMHQITSLLDVKEVRVHQTVLKDLLEKKGVVFV